MTNGNEPTGPGSNTPGDDAADDKTSIVQRPGTAAPDAEADSSGSDATTISQLPSTPPSSTTGGPEAPGAGEQPGSADRTQIVEQPGGDPFAAGTAQYTNAEGTRAESATPTVAGYGQQTPINSPQQGQTPINGPQYGQSAQPYGQAPQYGAPGAPQPGQFPQGQQQYGAPAYPQYAQPGQPGQPQAGQPQPGAGFGAPGQPGQPYGQPQAGADPTLNPYAPQQAPKKSSGKGALIAIIGGAVALIAAILLITAFVWPNWAKGSLSQDSVQAGVQKILTDAEPEGYGLKDVKDVQCPSGQKVEAGTTFTCSVSVNGQNQHVTVTVKDSDGTFEISRPTN